MGKMLKKTKWKIAAGVIAGVLVLGGIGGYFMFRDRGDGAGGNNLIYDYQSGKVASAKVNSAQYTPDMDKFIEANPSVQTSNEDGDTENNLTIEEFSNLVDEFGTIENYSGAGKYLGYDIYEIKNEISFVIDKAPILNQWFRMPKMREEEGYINIPYYENWAYLIELDIEPLTLSITRVCGRTSSSYLDVDNKLIIEDHDDGTSFIQYEIMKTNYYTNTDGDEVIECYIYSVGVDNVKDDCNENTNDYYPFEYQYLKNVKDKSLTKYHITAAERCWMSDYTTQDGTVGDDGMDIRGLNPYGVRREICLINYDGYRDIDVTKIDQKFPTLENTTFDGSVDFDIESENIRQFVKDIGLSNEKYQASSSANQLMDEMSKQIIDNFEIKNNWPEIYKNSDKAPGIDKIEGPFYGKEFPITDVYVYVSCRGHNQDEIEFDTSAEIYDLSKFDLTKEYSLSMALKNRETGELFVVATDYNPLQKHKYGGTDGTEEDDYYYTLTQTWLDLDASVINITQNGTYDIVGVLTTRENNEDVILFDTLEIAYLRQYCGLQIPSVEKDGVTYSYAVKSTGGKLTITVSSESAQ